MCLRSSDFLSLCSCWQNYVLMSPEDFTPYRLSPEKPRSLGKSLSPTPEVGGENIHVPYCDGRRNPYQVLRTRIALPLLFYLVGFPFKFLQFCHRVESPKPWNPGDLRLSVSTTHYILSTKCRPNPRNLINRVSLLDIQQHVYFVSQQFCCLAGSLEYEDARYV